MLKIQTCRALVAAFILAAGVVFAPQTAQADGVPNPLRIATEGAYPPFNNVNSKGELVGFDVEIAEAICKELRVKCKLVAQDWDGILPGLVANKYDAVIASMSITDERKQIVDFAGPYYSNYLRLVAPTGTVVNSLSDLDGRILGAQRATVAAQWAEDNVRGGEVKLYDTQTAAYSDLETGRVHVLVSDVYPAHDWLQTVSGYEFVGPRIDIDDKIGIAIRKGETELRDALDRALTEMRNNGVYKKVNENYFPFDIY
jgi:polar amino acid transport system substrate-binding protein